MGSAVLELEISRNPNADRLRDVAALLAFANEVVVPRLRSAERAAFFQKLGFGTFDALHLASAEQGQGEVFLTTDDSCFAAPRDTLAKFAFVSRTRYPGIGRWRHDPS